jgi:carbamoyl-phosphate synthase large subunit
VNILLSCAGRRHDLVGFFKNALGERGQVIVCDSSENVPAFVEADQRFIVPPIDHPDYFDVIRAICRANDVRLLISVNDLELGRLAKEAARFRETGTIAVISLPQVIALCQDKWATFQFLKSCSVPTPDTYLSLPVVRQALVQNTIKFPLLIKPRWGTCSIGIEVVENENELALAHEWGMIQSKRTIVASFSQADPDNCMLVQEYLRGQEYGMDIVNDIEGRHVCTLARRKLVMRAGSTDRAITVSEPRLERLGRIIGQRLAHIGNLDCDVMATDKGCMVLDLNPRFGGGYPFSHLAGADLPAALIAWANQEEPDPTWLKSCPGVLSAKYDGVAIMNQTMQHASACHIS